MTKTLVWWIIGWTTTCFVAAIFLFFVGANYRLELIGESSALNFLQQKGNFILEDARSSFSIAHASQIAIREMDTIFAGSDYNVHFSAATIRFKEIDVSDDAQIRISELNNSLVLSMSNVELSTLFQLTALRSISIRDNANDALLQISKPVPFETASVLAKKSAIDYQTSLCFNPGYTLRIKNLYAAELDFSRGIPGEGYRNSLDYLEILNETDKRFTVISTYSIGFKQIDELEIKCHDEKLNFRILGTVKRLRINGSDIRKSLYDHYVQPSGFAHLVVVFAWLIPLLASVLPVLLKQKL